MLKHIFDKDTGFHHLIPTHILASVAQALVFISKSAPFTLKRKVILLRQISSLIQLRPSTMGLPVHSRGILHMARGWEGTAGCRLETAGTTEKL